MKRVESVSDRLSYIVLRGRWHNIILVNVHAPSEEKSEESKDSFYEELEQVFDHFPKHHMKILLGDFNAKVGREIIFKPTIGQESLQQDSNDNGVRLVNFATSKNLVVKSMWDTAGLRNDSRSKTHMLFIFGLSYSCYAWLRNALCE